MTPYLVSLFILLFPPHTFNCRTDFLNPGYICLCFAIILKLITPYHVYFYYPSHYKLDLSGHIMMLAIFFQCPRLIRLCIMQVAFLFPYQYKQIFYLISGLIYTSRPLLLSSSMCCFHTFRQTFL